MLNRRTVAALPFVAVGIAAVISGGAVAAAVAYHPTEHLVRMVAYLVLVVGVMQFAFGAGQAWLALDPPSLRVTWWQWGLFNLGNVRVIAGTLGDRLGVVAGGTVLFVAAIAWFLWGVRAVRSRRWRMTYRVLVGLIFASSLIGLVISTASNSR